MMTTRSTVFPSPSPSGWGWAKAAPAAPARSNAAAAPRLRLRLSFMASFSLYERLDVDVETAFAAAAALAGIAGIAAVDPELDLADFRHRLGDGAADLGRLFGAERPADHEDPGFAMPARDDLQDLAL